MRYPSAHYLGTPEKRTNSLHFIPSTLIGTELLLVSCIDLWIQRRPSQSLAGEANPVFGAVVPVLGIDVNAISANSFRVATIVLLVLLGLSNQILAFVVGIPT